MTANSLEGLAERGASVMHAAFLSYRAEFNAVTCRARIRFEQRDWHGMQDDALERLELYKKIVDDVVADTQTVLGEAAQQAAVWVQMKACYSHAIAGYGDVEIAETFFNSLTRRIFATVGVDPGREYIDSDFNAPPARSLQPVYHTYLPARPTAEWLRQVLADYAFAAPYADLERDAALAAGEIDAHLRAAGLPSLETVETLKAVFYRNTGPISSGGSDQADAASRWCWRCAIRRKGS